MEQGFHQGRGTFADGEALYAARCANCHGQTGREGPNDVLVGREPRDEFAFANDPQLRRTVGNYWPYATTLFDYVRRAMPPGAPGSLQDDEVYGLVTYLLALNEIVPASAVMDATTLPKVTMPAARSLRAGPAPAIGGRIVRTAIAIRRLSLPPTV